MVTLRMLYVLCVASVAATLIATVTQDQKELGPADRPDLEEYAGMACFDTGYGFLFVKDKRLAEWSVPEVRRAALLFEKHFGVKVPRGIVVETKPGVPAAFPANAKEYEISWAFPLLNMVGANNSQDQERLAESIRKDIRRTNPGLDDEKVEELLKLTLARMEELGVSREPRFPLAHELGHQWYMQTCWSDESHPAGMKKVYGTPAPDYLDEVAAILMEPDSETKSRYALLASSFKDAKVKASLWSLKTLVTMEHPNLNFVAGGEVPGLQEARFYSVCRALIDYLHEATGNEKIFGVITEAAVKGKDFEQWLKAEGPSHKLPADITTLEKNWIAWIEARVNSKV